MKRLIVWLVVIGLFIIAWETDIIEKLTNYHLYPAADYVHYYGVATILALLLSRNRK